MENGLKKYDSGWITLAKILVAILFSGLANKAAAVGAIPCPWDFATGTSTRTCEAQANQAAARGNPNLVISMEGLCSGPSAGAAATARATARASGTGATVLNYSWLGGRSAAKCAEIWKNKFGKNLRLSFIGHSFGGGPGRKTAIDEMRARGVTVTNLIMFDPREAEDLRCGEGGGPKYRRPSNVAKVLNFYQCDNGLPGRTFIQEGNGRIYNHRIDGGPNSSHISLPGNATARRIITEQLALTAGRSAPMQLADNNTASRDTRNALERLFGVNPGAAAADPVKDSGGKVRAPTAYTGGSGRKPQVVRYNDEYWANNPKADKAAKCFRFGRAYDCTYREASEQNYDAYR